MTEPKSASELFQAAYENRYTWDENFPGYSADIEIKQGDEVYRGQVRLNQDLTVEVTGIADKTVQDSIDHQMRDIVTHRQRSSFIKTHGQNEFSLGDVDATGAVEILVKGKAMGSHYKVRDNEICQVTRVMGPMAFSIDTKTSLDTGEGYISTGYKAIFRSSETGELKGKREFEDTFEKIGNYYVMTRQVIHAMDGDTVTTTEFTFSNIKLLEPAVV